jgi:hypothetical protein
MLNVFPPWQAALEKLRGNLYLVMRFPLAAIVELTDIVRPSILFSDNQQQKLFHQIDHLFVLVFPGLENGQIRSRGSRHSPINGIRTRFLLPAD